MRKSRQVISSFSAGIKERKILSRLTKFYSQLIHSFAGQTKVMSKNFIITNKINLLIMHFIGKIIQNLLFNFLVYYQKYFWII